MGERLSVLDTLKLVGHDEFGLVLKCTRKPLKGLKIGSGMICVFKSSVWLPCEKWTVEGQERESRGKCRRLVQ